MNTMSLIRGASLATTFRDLTKTLDVISKPSKADVFISERRYAENVARPIKILFRSEAYYWVNERELELLRAGRLPEDLGLEPVGENE
ncbi:hypothetical protein ASD64_01465 [Mesorhizobium sp. Root157]|uniref:hypothetical protein n=1 Tax=Mesorhizobium sp. Root157 TaxID=1736477 RepID=UPI0006F6339D|nr:hypothetical protein [Mesorhizobium sp. Root157]KRA00269.1 hypothetical protein ASD64_01465 [Mesorhizobium sp. Root157]